MAAQSYSTGINQQNGVRRFRYSDWFPRSPSPKLKKLKIYETRCVDGPHGKNISNMIISWYCFVCKQLAPPQEIMSPLETASLWRNRTSWRQLQWVRISRESVPHARNTQCFYNGKSIRLLVQSWYTSSKFIPSLPQKTASDSASKLSIDLVQIDNTLVFRVARFEFSVISFV